MFSTNLLPEGSEVCVSSSYAAGSVECVGYYFDCVDCVVCVQAMLAVCVFCCIGCECCVWSVYVSMCLLRSGGYTRGVSTNLLTEGSEVCVSSSYAAGSVECVGYFDCVDCVVCAQAILTVYVSVVLAVSVVCGLYMFLSVYCVVVGIHVGYLQTSCPKARKYVCPAHMQLALLAVCWLCWPCDYAAYVSVVLAVYVSAA